MPDSEAVYVIAATSVQAVDLIDGGDTVALRMTGAGGEEICVLLRTGAVGELMFHIAEALAADHTPLDPSNSR